MRRIRKKFRKGDFVYIPSHTSGIKMERKNGEYHKTLQNQYSLEERSYGFVIRNGTDEEGNVFIYNLFHRSFWKIHKDDIYIKKEKKNEENKDP